MAARSDVVDHFKRKFYQRFIQGHEIESCLHYFLTENITCLTLKPPKEQNKSLYNDILP
ncbi:hypothetical protein MUK42_15714 [Musa troglodytarum]|uniref:Uncharacterized protein n=1 Tax=Musa troglodytarum TaxID=320322 RepID=A0A9E7GX44_9LILI|nr:hypothetical protein MUK42_15714 [Musa troglodytarum]